ncbi:MAG: phage tail tube protein [Clostridiales bacterium]|nr:phage tail tube protein [Clostridiales bacterium]
MNEEIQRSLGTKLKVGEGGSAKAVAGLTAINGLELTADTIDVTTLDSDGGYREFKAGFKDGGELSVDGFLITTEGKGQSEMYALFESGETEDYAVVFPEEMKAVWKFKGVVTGFGTSASLEDPISFSGTIKVSGKPELLLGAATTAYYQS